jgi:hypothetical protein
MSGTINWGIFKRHFWGELLRHQHSGNGQGTEGHFRNTLIPYDPHPLKWSDLRYVFDIKEDCNGREAIQA